MLDRLCLFDNDHSHALSVEGGAAFCILTRNESDPIQWTDELSYWAAQFYSSAQRNESHTIHDVVVIFWLYCVL